jgi:hypothetical protein
MEASREAAIYYRLRSEALKAEFQAKGIVIPDITDNNDDPFLSGALSRFLENSDSDRSVYIFAHLLVGVPGTYFPFLIINQCLFVFILCNGGAGKYWQISSRKKHKYQKED